ncbi:MAG: hypothetical protein OXT74_06805 [Candidatus Poribacteria bacterium]|nr:hypothetical protein [Candidatus Poribacteria bacterium]
MKRERRVVEFERGRADYFGLGDVDIGVLKEFTNSKQYGSQEAPEQILRDAGALIGRVGAREWTNAGVLFFTSNPRRVLSQAYIRLLRFECLYENEDERPTPTFEQDFSGPLTKQIRDFRTFVSDSGFFRTFEVRAADGGFVTEPEFPNIAIDEAVVNAVAHRDYGIRIPIICERYNDAFVVKSPGRMLQPIELPSEFRLREIQLGSCLRNQQLMDWLRAMKDAHGTAFVKAIREGTRRMRQEMDALGLPVPVYKNRPTETVLVLRNDIVKRAAKPTGLATEAAIDSDEFTNLYRLRGFDTNGEREWIREKRRVFLRSLVDRLEASGWIVDRFAKGRIVAHPKGA